MTDTNTVPSDQALECFVHGVAHLIDEQGYPKGLATATRLLKHLEAATDQVGGTPPAGTRLFVDDDLSIARTPAGDGHDHADQ